MFNLKDFNGTLLNTRSVNSFKDLKHQVLKEIVFCSTGLGWREQCSNVVEEQCILFPYVEKGSNESSEEYIKNFKFLVGSEITYFRNCVTGLVPVTDFSWDIDVTDNEDTFVLILHKM